MIKEFVEKWDRNKDKLEQAIRNSREINSCDYEYLVRLLFDNVINDDEVDLNNYKTDDMLVINDGDWQGTLVFILHKDTYQPSVKEYVYTSTYYGSCSGCDTLMAIQDYMEEYPDDKQVQDYMTLCLHLLQRCVYMGYGDD